MLQQVLDHLGHHRGAISLEDLCADLGLSPQTAESLLDLLVRKGRLEELGLGAEACSSCEGCPLIQRCGVGGVVGERYFRLVG